MMKSKIRKVINKGDLSEIEIMEMMNYIMEGKATNMQISAFLVALRMKGETIKEITGCARIMRDKAENIQPNLEYCIDTCGTGGDRANTFNISTAVAFVASACGVFVAKHGNRLVSSKSGSADVLESLGININIKPNEVKKCIEEVGIGFMFAPTFHKSMKYVAPVRKELGVRTIFNILGVLTNPANTKGQIIGIFDGKLTDMVANVLNNLQLEKAMVVHGMDGLDEITTTDKTKVSELKDGKVLNYYISPEEYGIALSNKKDLIGGDSVENAQIIIDIFSGEISAKTDIVIFNSAAALYVGKVVKDIDEGISMAKEIIRSGKATDKLEELKKYTNQFKFV